MKETFHFKPIIFRDATARDSFIPFRDATARAFHSFIPFIPFITSPP